MVKVHSFAVFLSTGQFFFHTHALNLNVNYVEKKLSIKLFHEKKMKIIAVLTLKIVITSLNFAWIKLRDHIKGQRLLDYLYNFYNDRFVFFASLVQF